MNKDKTDTMLQIQSELGCTDKESACVYEMWVKGWEWAEALDEIRQWEHENDERESNEDTMERDFQEARQDKLDMYRNEY